MAIQDELPKSRVTLRYRTEIHGQPEDIELPLRLLLMATFSGKHTHKKPLDEREPVTLNGRNTNQIINGMGIKLKISDSAGVEQEIPIREIDDFIPSNLAQNIPEIKHLVDGKKKMADMLSTLDNRKKVREAIVSLIDDKNKSLVESIRKTLAPIYEHEVKIDLGPSLDSGSPELSPPDEEANTSEEAAIEPETAE